MRFVSTLWKWYRTPLAFLVLGAAPAGTACGQACPAVDNCSAAATALPWVSAEVDLPTDRAAPVVVKGCHDDVCALGYVTSDLEGTAECVSSGPIELHCTLVRWQDGGMSWRLAVRVGGGYSSGDRVHVEASSEGQSVYTVDAVATVHEEDRGTEDCPQICGWTTLQVL